LQYVAEFLTSPNRYRPRCRQTVYIAKQKFVMANRYWTVNARHVYRAWAVPAGDAAPIGPTRERGQWPGGRIS